MKQFDFFFHVFIPSYKQHEKLLKCLDSFQNQIFKNFCVTIVDDASGISLSNILERQWNFELDYIINEDNLGAVPNMLHCMNLKSSSPFIIVFHEDDLAHPEYLIIAHKALMKFPEASLFCSNMSFFENAEEMKFEKIADDYVQLISDPKLFVGKILRGASISFTSCIYSNRKVNTNLFELDTYSMLADRPFIIKNLINNGFILFSESNLIAAQNHASTKDSRWRDLRSKHIFNISSFYKSFFNKKYKYDRFIMKKYLTRFIIEYYYLLEPDNRPNLLLFLTINMIKNNLSLPYLLLLNPTIRSIKKAFAYKLR